MPIDHITGAVTPPPMTDEARALYAEALEAERRFERAREKAADRAASRIREAVRQERLEDMGVGYMIYVARSHSKLSQRELARGMQTTQSAVSNWEAGRQLPTLRTMERVAMATGLELVIGLKHPDADDDLIALAVVDDEMNMTRLRMMIDYDSHRPIRPTGWRERLKLESWMTDYAQR
jgi:transcriptional regulator with XRE-family HTH domain